MKLFKYLDFIKENIEPSKIPTYEEAVELCSYNGSPFYEVVNIIDGFKISSFNYRLANHQDFIPDKNKEMRGISFVFNKNGTLYKRYILLEKFFNLNQIPDTMYSIVKNYKIKHINNKEDGSICQFLSLPNGKVVGKSKIGFDNDQAKNINRIYNTNEDIMNLVNWCLDNNIVAIFEYVSPSNKIVLRYPKEELILLRLRDNLTGKHISIKEHLDKIGSVKIAPFEDDNTLDKLIELSKTIKDKEGWVIQFDNDMLIKIKGDEYISLHGLLSEDIYKENIIIGYILDDTIDDILGKIPEEHVEEHERINKLIEIVRKSINDKIREIKKLYDFFKNSGLSVKDFALNYRKNSNFGYVMAIVKADNLKLLSEDQILEIYDTIEEYAESIKRCDIFELAKNYIRERTKGLKIAREWLEEQNTY